MQNRRIAKLDKENITLTSRLEKIQELNKKYKDELQDMQLFEEDFTRRHLELTKQ